MTYSMIDSASAMQLEVTPSELRIINALLAVADKGDESRSRISTSLLSERLGMDPSNTSKYLRGLKARRIIFKEGPGYWRVTPWYGFVGNWKDWDKIAKRFPEPEWKK